LQIFLYSALGAVIYLIAWAVPGHLITKMVPRVLCQVFAVIIVAFFIPSPDDSGLAYLSGQYAFCGGALLIGIWHMIQKLRGR